ncbi:hypothetical protein FSP39_021341 [Pinctada imbricata]|uniref:AP-5 complex subunit mu-1 n=1 Tax=Pinctada imbricata TaxID=66713 RepID=A0AA89BX75_PINIB|nr:hypothetical protein FSP39_021341 [Pinctada imbricata]
MHQQIVVQTFENPRDLRLIQHLKRKTFPTVEKQAKSIHGEHYVQLPKNSEFVNGLLFELGHKTGSEKFIQSRDTCRKHEQKPVYEVAHGSGNTWPIVVVEQRGLLFCCLPLVTQTMTDRKPSLIEIPSVTLGFSLLCGMADYLRLMNPREIESRISEMYLYLNIAAPFGCPLDVNSDTVTAKMYNKPSYLPKTNKQPAWKPVLYKGKSSIYLAITEYIRAIQYSRENVPDTWDLYGTISCKADLEGAVPDITINISHTPEGASLPLDHLMIHPCVQSADSAVIDPSEVKAAPRRVRFTPPAEMFALCHYTVSSLKQLPITAIYDMKMSGRIATLKVQLTLTQGIRNTFEYCELQMPFYNRGTITNHESTASQGNVITSPDKRILVWNVGLKFPPKSHSASLESTVTFTEVKHTDLYEDPFCINQNAYAQLFFKISDFTQSGCYIDPKSTQVSPNTKFKLTTVQEYVSAEYKVWNCNGDALISSVPKSLLTNEHFPDKDSGS